MKAKTLTRRQQMRLVARLTRSSVIRDYVTDRLFCYRETFGETTQRVIQRGHERTWRIFS